MNLLLKFSLFIILLIWCLGIFSEWLLPLNQNILLALPFLEKTYSLVCHQIKEKLIISGNFETLVCARCTGIYLGLLLSSFVFVFKDLKKMPDVKYLFIMSVPLFTDVILTSFDFYTYSRTLAFCTGFLLGSTGFLYLYSALNQLIIELKSNRL